jgi:phytoene/squalene synthetase
MPGKLTMPVDHYENFPVASILLPARLRPAVEAIYRFARSADDIADEGDAAPEQRLAELGAYEAALDRIEQGKLAESRLFKELGAVIASYAAARPTRSARECCTSMARRHRPTCAIRMQSAPPCN